MEQKVRIEKGATIGIQKRQTNKTGGGILIYSFITMRKKEHDEVTGVTYIWKKRAPLGELKGTRLFQIHSSRQKCLKLIRIEGVGV